MKPLNLDNRPCSPVSSNCVIWQGPNISCINLCTGDTVSDVVSKLATELCTLLAETNVSNYDLTCLGVTTCGPQDFQALIQLLIDKICELQGIPAADIKSNGCPDCLVSVAPCFVENGQTTMQLIDYVQMIANKICDLIAQIADIQTQIDNLDIRVTILEETPPPTFTLPSIATGCLSPYMSGAVSATIDLVLNTLVNNATIGYCALIDATGLPGEIYNAVVSQCITSSSPTISNPPTPFGTEYLGSWVSTPETVADAITNLWIVVCDFYDYLSALEVTGVTTPTVSVSVSTGPAFVVTAKVVDTDWVDLLGFSYMSANTSRPQCRRIGNTIHFRGYIIIPMGTAASGASGNILSAPFSDSYITKKYGNTFNTVNSSNAADSCELITYGGGSWTSGTAIGLRFNRGNSVIPTAVLPVGQSLDGTYTLGTRQIIARTVRSTDDRNAALHSLVAVFITNTGELGLSTILYDEDFDGALGYEYSGIGRHLISNIISGEKIPTYTPTAPSIFNAAAVGAYKADITGVDDEWAFSQNAGHADQLGGFIIQLSGLSTFVDPCDTYIPTQVVC
jgi:hypothetical protein